MTVRWDAHWRANWELVIVAQPPETNVFMHLTNFVNAGSGVQSNRVLVLVATCVACIIGAEMAWATTGTVTATFENYSSQFLGFGPVTDPLSGITFNNINPNGGLGVSYFNAPGAPSLYVNNNVLEENDPAPYVFWSGNFSIRGLLPQMASSLSVDILYDYDPIADPAGPNGKVTLNGYDSLGNLVGSISTPALNLSEQQTHLALSFASPISSFTVVANNLSTDYDNISFTAVPEPSNVLFLAVAAGALGSKVLRRRRR